MGEWTQCGARGIEHPFNITLQRHIALDRNCFAAGLFHGLDDGSRCIRVRFEIHRNVITARASQFCCGSANTAASAGDEQDWSRHLLLQSSL